MTKKISATMIAAWLLCLALTVTASAATVGSSLQSRERYSGTLAVGQGSTDMKFGVRRSTLDAQITFHPGGEQVTFELIDPNNQVIATTTDRKIAMSGLASGNYNYRVRGSVSKAVDFTIKSTQGK